MTTYRIAFINKYDISRCFVLDNLFDLRDYIFDKNLKGLTVGKIVDDTVEYFVTYNGGKREEKLVVNMPLIK